MNLHQFFEHWSIVENPFRGEEARHDAVFARLGGGVNGPVRRPGEAASDDGEAIGAGGRDAGDPGERGRAGKRTRATLHSDFEKILGEPDRPSSAIVFGEKGSGKTAIRLQLEQRIEEHNRAQPRSRALLVAYDELNPILDRFHARMASARAGPDETLKRIRQVDHLDAILSLVVPRLVDAILARRGADRPLDLGVSGPEAKKAARRLDLPLRRDLLLLQAVYDRPEEADHRSGVLRRGLRLGLPAAQSVWLALAWAGWIPAAALFLWAWLAAPEEMRGLALTYVFLGLVGLWLVVLVKRVGWDVLGLRRLGWRLRRQVRVGNRGESSYARSLAQLHPSVRDGSHLPLTDSDEQRYAMVKRLRRVLAPFGYASIIVVIDRVDEPTLVSGDPERMRSFIWPMLNNKFLQQEGVGFKMLLPIELRHALFKESSQFFQEARLDKQNLIERLTWTGAMLYDLCDARLNACRPAEAEPISLLDLFAEDVTRQDLVDALDQMHQPRDAFKFLYHVLNEHCSNVTAEQAQWRVPRLILETVRKQQSDRVQQLYRGIRPA